MINQKKWLSTCLLAGGCIISGFSQESAVSAGGDASGTSGSSSFSVGQVIYTVQKSKTGELIQGVQQPYEVITVERTEQAFANITCTVFPNPTLDGVTLSFSGRGDEHTEFLLFAIDGKEISTGTVKENNTLIEMPDLASGMYLLHVSVEGKIIQTFKIIRNN